MRTQQGFTLIELIMVIVIIGILAATALPRFVDLSDEANLASAQGIAGAIQAGNTINVATCRVSATNPDCVTGLLSATAANCQAAAAALLDASTSMGNAVIDHNGTNCIVDGDGDTGTAGDQVVFTVN